ncbi:hypothetical protein OSH11_11655 [Kaistia dalseonensis]|uniref:Dit-like phage tail protein N-terminal domain-containing protein n=1 Tax=Kaistia dalseonensis TaxID=410840 RepID=A0ABU0H907_9HYPH|nr:hypothetical protein [Kaistia dalseonensis]MCX5495365.1 hypothetical protein [Kaistia dalseonensis]MDQ0437951.1 hypothetical protein [Kaistia dalseonensis]
MIKPRRIIGTVIPDVVVEEVARDNLFVTQHPVEQGASISDHAFSMPVELEMQCGWSNSTAGYVGYIDLVYQEMLSLQAMREPFTVYTPYRAYPNMLISALERTTDERSPGALLLRVGMREVIIVSTEVASIGNAKSSQAIPQKTTTSVSAGTKQVKPSNGYAGNGA